MREAARFIASQTEPAQDGTLLRFVYAALGSRPGKRAGSNDDLLWHVSATCPRRLASTVPIPFPQARFRQSEIATLIDAAPIADLVNAAYRGAGGRLGWIHEAKLLAGDRASLRDVVAMIDDVSTTVLVRRGGRSSALLGCVAIQMDGADRCVISMLAVDPELQSAGLGRALLADAEQFAASNGARSAVMTVIRQRQSLIAWYERCGYHRTGAVAFPYGASKVGTPLRDDLDFVILEMAL
ncbi:GNAT family N-acetyltransferase [Taklimakanibacter deserti]|uniref:GNAT family N-acetyltransferase n=1 Tax=Taklimakanibacter deserti TaxID=2267839 RepID=UPI0013C478D6